MPAAAIAKSRLTAAHVRGARANLLNVYERERQVVEKDIGDVMDMSPTSDGADEIYPFFESAPHWRIWHRGQAREFEGIDAKNYTIANKDWQVGIPFDMNDLADARIGNPMERAKQAGDDLATLDERVMFQMMTGAADPDLLPVVPNAADGAALYSATNGAGGDRFGRSGGNIVGGSGVVTAAAFRGDYFNALEVVLSYQDTKGQPLWDMRMLKQGVKLFFNHQNLQVALEAFRAEQVLATAAATGGAITNVVLVSGVPLELVATPRITDNDSFLYARGARHKALIRQVRQEVEEDIADRLNSDEARETRVIKAMYHARRGYGIGVPFQTVKINNS